VQRATCQVIKLALYLYDMNLVAKEGGHNMIILSQVTGTQLRSYKCVQPCAYECMIALVNP